MVTHRRSITQTAISVSMPKSMVELIDQRSESLGLNRSQYLAQLARQDLAVKGDLILSANVPDSRVVPSNNEDSTKDAAKSATKKSPKASRKSQSI